MHLRRIRLQNYRRHRETEFEFPDGVIALLGRNGSGKSTILEAIGFALFGTHATRTGKELLRHDRAAPGDPVRVELDMELGGQAIEVVRELRGRNLTPQASLTVDGHTVVPPQTGSSDAVTQAMEGRIGMGREAFFTTVVARQKELSRLTDQSPADRKRLILGMLGIDAVDRAIQQARTQRREADIRVETMRQDLPDMDALRVEEKEAKGSERAAKEAVARAQKAWERARGGLETAEKETSRLEAAHEERREAEVRRTRLRDRLATHENRLADLRKRLSAAGKAAEDAKGLETAAADRGPARKALDEAQAVLHRHERLADAEKEVARLAKQHDAIEVPAPPNGLLERLQAEVEVQEKRHAEAREAATVLATEFRQVQDRMRRTASLTEATPCPVCERPLEGHLPELQEHLEQEKTDKESRRIEAEAAARGAEDAVRAKRRALEEAMQLVQRHERLADAKQAAAQRLAEAQSRVKTLSEGLPERPDTDALRGRLQKAEAAHEARTRALAAAEQVPALRKETEATRDEIDSTRREADAVTARLESTPETGPALQKARAALEAARRDERAAERAHVKADQQLTAARQASQHIQKRLEEARERQQRLRTVQEDAEYWQALVGQRGGGLLDRFKAHLVSRVGPAVSREASRLLDRFTAGRYTEVLLDEEYQLYVGDAGVHYELARFSGGESDLVHLALRLAVSRLLLERSGGAELRFLALDEVFGSLDAERRDSVLGALQELGGLYAQVLVVTHQDALRDALDAAILVEEDDGEAHLSFAS